MRFADPTLLALLALLPLFAWLLRREARRPTAALRLPGLTALAPLIAASSLRRRTLAWLPALRLAAAALIVLAIARPQTAGARVLTPAEGVDIVLTFDVSSSMEDNRIGDQIRLEAARRVARDFVAARGEDRVALVVFQAESLVLSPLTLDHQAIDDLLVHAVHSGLLRDGTAVGLALAESLDLLRDSTAPSRVAVLLTDGEDNIRIVRPVEAAAIAQALGIRVYTIGVATPDAIQGVVDELALRFIAEATGGQYFRAAEIDDLENAYASIDALEKARVGAQEFTRYRELAAWFLLPGLGLALLELLAHATWWRRAP